MITIPTVDLVSLFADTIPFAEKDGDYAETHCVHIRWDGQLHTQATDSDKFGWSTWDPRNEESDAWGGADDEWSASIALVDAKALTKMFKLAKADLWTPVTVEQVGRSVRFKRDKIGDLPALVMVAADLFLPFPDLQEILADHDTITPVGAVELGAADMATFAKVRRYGPMVVRFCGNRAVVTVGSRFTGSVSASFDDPNPAEVNLTMEIGAPIGGEPQ